MSDRTDLSELLLQALATTSGDTVAVEAHRLQQFVLTSGLLNEIRTHPLVHDLLLMVRLDIRINRCGAADPHMPQAKREDDARRAELYEALWMLIKGERFVPDAEPPQPTTRHLTLVKG